MDDVINNCKVAIYHYISKQRDPAGKFRTPPLMIASHARSGKTSTLENLHNSLITDSTVTPIFITFNGTSDYSRFSGETDVEGFLRVLATGLTSASGCPVECSTEVLEKYLSTADKPIVLLVRCFLAHQSLIHLDC